MTRYRHTQIGWVTIVITAVGIAVFGAILVHERGSIVGLVGLLVVAAALAVFSTLTIEITDEEFRFHFSFGLFARKIPMAAIAECAEVEISMLYGWGIRMTPAGKLYNVSGRKGVELRLRSGERLLVGSDEPARVCAAVNQPR